MTSLAGSSLRITMGFLRGRRQAGAIRSGTAGRWQPTGAGSTVSVTSAPCAPASVSGSVYLRAHSHLCPLQAPAVAGSICPAPSGGPILASVCSPGGGVIGATHCDGHSSGSWRIIPVFPCICHPGGAIGPESGYRSPALSFMELRERHPRMLPEREFPLVVAVHAGCGRWCATGKNN